MLRLRAVIVTLVIMLAGVLSLTAQQVAQIYISSEGQSALQQLNFATGQLTNLYEIGAPADDMILNSAGQLIYSVPSIGDVNLYDPTTGINSILCTGIIGARDLAISPDGSTLFISRYVSPAEIYKYNFATQEQSLFVPKTKGISAFDGIAFDAYGNFYAVASHNTIIQINPSTGAILSTITLQAHNGVNGGDGMAYDPTTSSLWITADGKVMGIGLIQIPVQASGFVSTSPGFTFHPLMKGITNVDGIKSDGQGYLYVGALWSAFAYDIATNSIVANVVVKGADGVSPVPGTYGPAVKNPLLN
jgi:sugar lactone lactonase YvrE